MSNLDFPRARLTDPETSQLAADTVDFFVVNHYEIILKALKENGPMGKDGIASKANIEKVQVSRRLPEMLELELVKLTGRKVASFSNRLEREWEAA